MRVHRVGETIYHYRITDKLGSGGMGVVYKAEDLLLKRPVALKFLPEELSGDEQAKQRFMIEARAASGLDHPNICTIHEVGETEDGQLFIVMGYYEGETLKKKLRSGPLSIAQCLRIAGQIAAALATAHRQGIIHRDIKPANIMLTNDGNVKILDFGLAKMAGTQFTIGGTLMGTMPYMAPEQLRSEAVDQRADIWSLGAILYEMLGGAPPFRGDNDAALLYTILHEDPPSLSEIRVNIPPVLQEIVSKALVKKAGERYQHTDEILTDLEELSASGTLTTASEIPRKPGQPSHKRLYFTAAIIIGFAVVALLLLIIFSIPRRDGSESSPSRPVLNHHHIAVLPLTNMSPDPEDLYFADGMTEELISTLSHIDGFRVIARTSMLRYRGLNKSIAEIGEELHVGTVLEGSVRKSGSQLRISVHLIDVATQTTVWSQDYNKEFRDVFLIQRDIAQQTANALKVELLLNDQQQLVRQATENLEAYQSYLRGRYHWERRTEGELDQALKYFKLTIERDPNFALAYTGLADVYHFRATYSSLPPREAFPEAKKAVLKALEIDETLAEGYSSLAAIKLFYEWDWPGAEAAFRKAIALNPNYSTAHEWYASFYTVRGEANKAIEEMKKGLQLDPLSLSLNTGLGRQYYLSRQYDKAIEQYKKALAIEPNYIFARVFLGLALLQTGNHEEAIDILQTLVEVTAGSDPGMLAALGYAYGVSGGRTETLRIIKQLQQLSKQRYITPFYFAVLYAALGENDRAFHWLERAYLDRSEWMVYLHVEPLLDNLRSDTRLAELLKKTGLKQRSE